MSPRRLGQHFLADPTILDRIVDALDPMPGETVLEIGSGRGTLTEALLRRGLRVIAIEKDRELAASLRRDSLTVVAGDALELEWPNARKVVGNADRLAAKPGSKTYGGLSVGVQAVARVEKLFTVAPGAFRPPPKVRSALVRLTPLADRLVGPDEIHEFRVFVTACFSKRRKQLKNAVPGHNAADLKALGFDPQQRPEQLPPDAFVRLFRSHRTRQ